MISHLRVLNFQCVDEFDEDLSPGVNVFMGRSGIGKSARAIRPLKWLRFNRPLGESYRRWNTDRTLVEVTTLEGNTISREKSDKDNLYKLDGKEFRSFGQNPPDEVLLALNLNPINFQFQHDPLFLLSMTQAELSKTLNEIAGLDDIDISRKRINSMLFRGRQEANRLLNDKETLEKELDKYKDIDKLEDEVMVADRAMKEATDLVNKHYFVVRVLDKIDKVTTEEDKYRNIEEAEREVSKAVDRTNSARKSLEEELGLRKILAKINVVDKELKLYAKLENASRDLDSTSRVAEESADLYDRLGEISEIYRNLILSIQKETELTVEWEKLNDEFNALMPEVCPLCGTKLPMRS